MKININKLTNKPLVIEEEVIVPEDFKCTLPLSSVKKITAKVTTSSFEDFVEVNLEIKADVVLQSVYSLNLFDSVIKSNEEYHFGNDVEEDSDLIPIKGNFINMDEYVLNLLSASIPVAPKEKGDKIPDSGSGYRVLSEEEFNKEKENKTDPRFDKLKDLDFD